MARARIWLAPDDSVHGRVWVWHARNGDPGAWGWRRTWADALRDCMNYLASRTP